MIDKSFVYGAVKLSSPYSGFTLYRYHVRSSMPFGSGFTAIKTLPNDKKCDFTKRDFFTFGNHYPLQIKWKSKDTLHVICISEDGLAASQPVRKDVKKWKNWTFEVEYYSLYSTGTNGSHSIKRYGIGPNTIRFVSDKQEFEFNNIEVAIEVDGNQISLRQFKVDTFNTKAGVSLSDYRFDMSENYRMKDFYRLQPFITIEP